jgi:hypothetical protein
MSEIYCDNCTNPKKQCLCKKRTYNNQHKAYEFSTPKEITAEQFADKHAKYKGMMISDWIELMEAYHKHKLSEKVEQLEEDSEFKIFSNSPYQNGYDAGIRHSIEILKQ